MFYVYLIKNVINNKVYVGKTSNVKVRWQKHKKSGYLLYRAIKKYGEDNFIISVLEECREEKNAFEKERYWIEFYKCNICRYQDSLGYNLTDGGEGPSGHKLSLETRLKISKSLTGKPLSEEHKLTLSKIKSGCKLSEIHKKNIGVACTGKIRSDESKIRYHESKLGIKNPKSKLNDEKVKEIKRLLLDGEMTCEEIGKLYNVHRRTIQDIKLDKTWKHVSL